MPLLGGLFSKKNKASSRLKQDDHATADLDSNVSSPTSSSYHTQYLARQPASNTITRKLFHPDSSHSYQSNTSLSIPQSPPPVPVPGPPPPQSSGHRLRLPGFGRKKSNISGKDLTSASTSDLNHNHLFSTSPRPSFTHRTSSSIDGQPPPLPDSQDPRRLRPPPSRSAIFAAYGDPNGALSTRSLPNESELPSSSSDPLPSPSPSAASARPPRQQNPHKRPSLFVWSKNSNSTPAAPQQQLQGSSQYESNLSPNTAFDSGSESHAESAAGSFALKSFRNVREPSPANNSNVSLSAPVPRPRGESVTSEMSQRISVAAFREAQARRSMAGSPSPSFRSPSPGPALPQPPAISSDTTRGRGSPKPSRSSPHIRNNQNRRRSLLPVSTSESDDDSPDSSDPESEDDQTMRPPISMNHTRLPQRSGKTKAKSEMGHGSRFDSQNANNNYNIPPRPPKSHTGHSLSTSSPLIQPRPAPRTETSASSQEVPNRSQSSLSNYGNGLRQRASASTSALTPSAAAKRASIVAASNAAIANSDDRQFLTQSHSTQQIKAPPAISGRTNSSMPTTKPVPDSGSDSDDDAPLATLVAPRRPGSAMSSYSATYSRSTGNVSRTGHPTKPLIDINELTNPKPNRTLTAEKSTEGFTQGRTLLALQTTDSFSGSPLVHSPTAMSPSLPPLQDPSRSDTQPLTRTVPPHKFISPPSSPPKELKQYFSDQSLAETTATASGSSPPARDSSPEASKRVPLTDRLSRAVKLNTSPSSASPNLDASTSSAPEVSTRQSSDLSKTTTAPLPPSTSQSRVPGHRRLSSGMKAFSTPAAQKVDPSPPDEDLAQLLGTAGIKFISRTGESSPETSDTESEAEKPKTSEVATKPFVPIPIKQRSPPPAFSVTSRPSFPKHDMGTSSVASTSTSDSKSSTSPPTSFTTPRQRSSTLIPSSSSVSITPKPTGPLPLQQNTVPYPGRPSLDSNPVGRNNKQPPSSNDRNTSLKPPGTRQRSSTMITGVPLSSQMSKAPPHLIQQAAPEKPFAPRRDSPASSIGDSSSGRAPLTPKDGSDIAPPSETQSTIKKRTEWSSSGVSGLGVKQHIKRRSVSFEDDGIETVRKPVVGHFRGESKSRNDSGSGDTSNEEDKEIRRRERRRSEARAAIELGNVINGRGPVVSDDDDDVPLNAQIPMNPMMAQGGQMQMPMGYGTPNQMLWPGNMNMGTPGMLSPAQFMLPPPPTQDPNYLMAHQQAMMIAKQAYQMAVAQQAMAAAADEWERGSAIGGFGSGGSAYGGSVYGGSTASPSLMVPQYMNMGGMGNMGMNMNMNMIQNQWSSGSSVYNMPSSSRSMYGGMMGGISSSRSEYGGVAPSANKWSSSRSTYGESFGPPSTQSRKPPGALPKRPLLSDVSASQRDSSYFPSMPPVMPASQNSSGRSSPDMRNNNPRGRTASQPVAPIRSPGQQVRKAAPPSSWKASGV